MSRAVVEPEGLRSFAMELKRFAGEVQSQLVFIRRSWAVLGESWQDQERMKFAAVFERAIGVHGRLADEAERHVQLLTRKAQKINDYLGPQLSGTARHAAQISSPDLIREFRIHFLKFEERSKQAVSGVRSDCGRIVEWLRRDQLQYWKEEFRKAEEVVRQARSAYLEARHGSGPMKKPSYVDEEKLLRKAERRKEEVERKIEAVKKWTLALEQQTTKLMGPLNSFAGLLDSTAPLARSRLDRMAESLDDYLREVPAELGAL